MCIRDRCGSGRTEFLECIYGTRKLAGGEVMIDGKTTTRPTPSESIRQGMAFICEDRRGKAMIPAFSVEENMMLSSIDRYTKSGWFQKRAADKKAMDMIEALKIKCVGVSQPAKELSGGNQQKVVFAKALLTEPSIWLCDCLLYTSSHRGQVRQGRGRTAQGAICRGSSRLS